MNKLLLLLRNELLICKTKMLMLIGILVRRTGSALSLKLICSNKGRQTKVLIESGSLGWESVFYSEFKASLREYIRSDHVAISTIDRSQGYLRQAIKNLHLEKPTHYCVDPRTGSQNPFHALLQTMILGFYLGYYNIVPVVILTDGSIRIWRYQSLMLTGDCGVIVTFLDVKSMGRLFTHSRVIGPLFMPISQSRLNILDERSQRTMVTRSTCNEIFFLGSLYPKRIIFFDNLNRELLRLNSKVQILIESKSSAISSEEYWDRITNSECLITTGFQHPNSNYKMDRLDVDQMVFRISETLAAGKLLFCTNIVGMENYFIDGVHFVGFSTFKDAAKKIDYYSRHPDLGREIARNGRRKLGELTMKNTFWGTIELSLVSNIHSQEF